MARDRHTEHVIITKFRCAHTTPLHTKTNKQQEIGIGKKNLIHWCELISSYYETKKKQYLFSDSLTIQTLSTSPVHSFFQGSRNHQQPHRIASRPSSHQLDPISKNSISVLLPLVFRDDLSLVAIDD
jgi:hypothetical protein